MSINLRESLKYTKQYFNLMHDKEDEREVVEQVRGSIVFRGTNLWILIFAILIASLGLNVNSTAVIIGAMLVSPLMGPMRGETSMAPMMTAVELTLSPSEAIRMANMRIHRLVPRNTTPALTCSITSRSSSRSPVRRK